MPRSIREFAWDDDIVELEGIQLDMENQDSDFDLEIDFEVGDFEVEPINTKTCLLIEVCRLPLQEEHSMIHVTWY